MIVPELLKSLIFQNKSKFMHGCSITALMRIDVPDAVIACNSHPCTASILINCIGPVGIFPVGLRVGSIVIPVLRIPETIEIAIVIVGIIGADKKGAIGPAGVKLPIPSRLQVPGIGTGVVGIPACELYFQDIIGPFKRAVFGDRIFPLVIVVNGIDCGIRFIPFT